MDALLRDRSVLYVTGKGGVGKTTVAAAIGLAAAQDRPADDRLRGRRAGPHVARLRPPRRAARAGGRARRRACGRSRSTRSRRSRSGSASSSAAAPPGVLGHSHAFQYFVAAAPGAKELITIAKVWELAQPQRWDKHNRTYDLVVVDAPASGHGIGMLTTPRTFGEIARVGPIRRQADEGLRHARRPGAHRATSPSRCRRRCRSTRRSSSSGGCATRSASGSTRSSINAMWPERFSSADVTKLRAAARDGFAAEELGAVRAALAAHERVKAQRMHLRRLEAAPDAPISTLPFVFESELGLERLPAARRPARSRLMDAPQRPLSPIARRVWRLQQLGIWGALFVGGVIARHEPRRARPAALDRAAGRARARDRGDPAAALVALALGRPRRGHRHPATGRSRSGARWCRGSASSTSTRAAASSSRASASRPSSSTPPPEATRSRCCRSPKRRRCASGSRASRGPRTPRRRGRRPRDADAARAAGAPRRPPPRPRFTPPMPETRRLHPSAVAIYSADALRSAAFPLDRDRRHRRCSAARATRAGCCAR